jgi:hypothetical protein
MDGQVWPGVLILLTAARRLLHHRAAPCHAVTMDQVPDVTPDFETRVRTLLQDFGIQSAFGDITPLVVEEVEREPQTYEEYLRLYEVGCPVFPVTVWAAETTLRECADLRAYVNDLYGCVPLHSANGITYELTDELDASLYLVLAGHYRSSCAVLRTALESALLDLYFYWCATDVAWRQGDTYLPHGAKLIDQVFHHSDPQMAELGHWTKDLSRRLNQYVHFTSEKYINRGPRYDPESFSRWYRLFLDTAASLVVVVNLRGVDSERLPDDHILHRLFESGRQALWPPFDGWSARTV